MGYDIWQRDSSFCIRKENFPGLVKAAIQRFPTWFDEMSSVREIFKGFDFGVAWDPQRQRDGADTPAPGLLSDAVFLHQPACPQ